MLSGQDKIQVAVNTMKYGAFDYIVKSESAFLRSEHVIFNIIKSLKLEGERNRYKKLTYWFAGALIVTLITIAIVYKMGLIKDHPNIL
jgi:two-component system OmpR family response regulator